MLRFLSDPDLRGSARSHAFGLIVAALFVCGRSILALAGPFYLGRGVDLVVGSAPTGEVDRLVAVMAAFALSTAICQFWMRRIWIAWSRKGEMQVRGSVFGHLLTLPMPFHNASRTGDLMSRLTSDVEAVRMGYGPGLMHIFQTGVMAVGALGFMVLCSPWLALWATIPMLVMFVILSRLMRRVHDHSMAVQEQQAALSARAQESFSGSRVVKAFSREEHEEGRFESLSLEFLSRSVELARTRAWFRCYVEQFAGIAIVLVLVVGGHQVISGQITVGDYAAFNGYLQMLIWPVIAIGWTLALFQRAEAAEKRIQTLREQPAEELESSDVPQRLTGAITLRDLTFTHTGGSRPAVEKVSLELQAGTTLGIVGRTGSGKSTLANLVLRLYEPPRNSILLDGVCVRALRLTDLRRDIALVPQDSFLFRDTIAANVGFSVDDATPAAVAEAARVSCLDEAIAGFPRGIETRVGERGVTLSGGQRQRAAIARAILPDAPILILDDAFSAVDTETEQEILDRLLPVMRGRTTLLISHRVSTVRHADHIIVLSEGRIAERGTHVELLERRGIYAEIHRLQQEADELESL